MGQGDGSKLGDFTQALIASWRRMRELRAKCEVTMGRRLREKPGAVGLTVGGSERRLGGSECGGAGQYEQTVQRSSALVL